MGGALDGVRVLDLSRVLAGPWAGQTLGDLGADVVHVERPGRGDESRSFGPPFLKAADGSDTAGSAMYLSANRNKRSVTINIACAEGQALVRALAARSDVLIENYKVGDLARYGLDYDSLSAVNPRLVYCSITGFGQSGPYRDRGGYDPMIQALSGIMSITGDPDDVPGGGPMKAGPSIVDMTTGLYASIAVLAALRHRDQTSGRGQHIDLALLDCGFALTSHLAQIYAVTGASPGRVGTRGYGGAPGGGFRCADGHIMVAPGNDRLYAAFVGALGRPDLATDPRFAANRDRLIHRKLLVELCEAETRKHTVEALYAALTAAGVPAAPIRELEDVFGDPQIQAREMVVTAPQRDGGAVTLLASPIRLSDTPIEVYRAPPGVGDDTDAVLGELLGLDGAALADLRHRQVI